MYESTNDNGLNNNGIWCFHRDREGILWIGTSGGGIIIIIQKKKDSNYLGIIVIIPNHCSYNFMVHLYEDHEGLIWIGTIVEV